MTKAGTSLQPAPVTEILEQALAGNSLSEHDAIRLIECSEAELPLVMRAAAEIRDRGKGHEVTYSRKVFLPITNLCRDRCTYCTFRKDPKDPGAWTMTLTQVAQWSRRGRELGCKEALMCLGDKPELAFREYRELLATRGAANTVEYVSHACKVALEEGLLPHTNAGIMTREEISRLRPLNASMGLMLENISPRLRRRGGPHQWAPDKEPAVRMRMLDDAGALRVPFTTGILLGIGETPAERAQSLFAIRQSHERYGHIQEVIIQNFRAKPGIAMAEAPEPDAGEMVRAIATARLLLGPDMNVQAPPNLSPNEIELFLQAGINDWGGISPLSKDYVNPEAPWPHLEALAMRCARAGFHLKQRLAIYPEFINPEWVDPAMMPIITRLANELGSEV
jgi:7,8-didemethyl-8-hydroxy-5-deazariboflavin synthase CofG subunit